MIFPIDYVGVTKKFSRNVPIHWGVDLGWHTITNRAITSAADGVVQFCGTREDGALYVVIYHEQINALTKYWHLSKITVTKGQLVKQGQQIGNMGSTGLSTAPHLHFETWTNLPKGYVYWDKNTKKQVQDRDIYAVDPLTVTYLTKNQTLSPKEINKILRYVEPSVDLSKENTELKLEINELRDKIVEQDKQILVLKNDNLTIKDNIMDKIETLLFK